MKAQKVSHGFPRFEEKVWMAQKMMLKKTKAAGKYAVCATEMLASMEAGWVQWLGLVGRNRAPSH